MSNGETVGSGVKKPTLLLFEPWGLGDLAISLGIARESAAIGYSIVVLCHPRYLEWIRALPFVEQAYGIEAPWAQARGKYRFWDYPWKAWQELRKVLSRYEIDVILELRRDPRAKTLLYYLSSGRGRNVFIRPRTRRAGLGYRRSEVLKILPSHTAAGKLDQEVTDADAASKTHSKAVLCFFGAEWKNRRLPAEKARVLLETLGQHASSITVIVPPEERESPFYQNLAASRIECVSGSISEIAKKVSEFSHLISTDSGWLHVGHLYGLKTIGLFGFDNDDAWAPPGSRVLRSEHCLPGKLRYWSSARDLAPLGTLREESISAEISRLH